MPVEPCDRHSSAFAIQQAGRFLRTNCLAVVLISALLLVPCFWHSHIQAGDLGSHVYNAWLAQLAQSGQAPGVYVARQWNNVLFDVAVGQSAKLFGWHGAELFAVSLSVLIFFWGVFSFVA